MLRSAAKMGVVIKKMHGLNGLFLVHENPAVERKTRVVFFQSFFDVVVVNVVEIANEESKWKYVLEHDMNCSAG